MQLTRIFTILCLLGLILTTVLSDSTSLDMDNNDNHAIFKRFLSHHSHHSDQGQPRQCVQCKFSLIRCCSPNVCVKRRLRMDKCLRVKT
jgi:hypothetical protein